MGDSESRRHAHEQRLAWIRLLQLTVGKGTAVLVAFFFCATCVMTARYLAGKKTKADVTFRMIANFGGFRSLATLGCVGLGTAGVGYGAVQRAQRKKEKERHEQIQASRQSAEASKPKGTSQRGAIAGAPGTKSGKRRTS